MCTRSKCRLLNVVDTLIKNGEYTRPEEGWPWPHYAQGVTNELNLLGFGLIARVHCNVMDDGIWVIKSLILEEDEEKIDLQVKEKQISWL